MTRLRNIMMPKRRDEFVTETGVAYISIEVTAIFSIVAG